MARKSEKHLSSSRPLLGSAQHRSKIIGDKRTSRRCTSAPILLCTYSCQMRLSLCLFRQIAVPHLISPEMAGKDVMNLSLSLLRGVLF